MKSIVYEWELVHIVEIPEEGLIGTSSEIIRNPRKLNKSDFNEEKKHVLYPHITLRPFIN